MNNTVNIDIGGTFTDCYVTQDGRAVSSKVPTTRYNLSVGFNQAIANCARELGLPLDVLLAETDMIRYATTLAMNALIERKGPKLALITTAGFEDTIFIGRGAQHHDGLPIEGKRLAARYVRPEPLIPRKMVVGVRERVAADGAVIIPLDRQDVLDKLQQLVDRGATGFVVSLMWAHLFPDHERQIRAIIEEEYPDVYLGSHPVLLSSEVLPKQNEYQRTMTTILDAYLHRAMAEELTELGNELRDKGYPKSLYIVHHTGGCAPITRTASIKTYNGGPVGGLMGACMVGEAYGYRNIVATDMGGTSFDIGLAVEGDKQFTYASTPIIDRWRVGLSMIETKSIGAGGGSIAKVNQALGGILEVGPQSAGSLPGPACFDRGGEEPTVTDADVVLGYVNPDHFLGGKLRLNKEKAVRAVREKIAQPLGISVEQAALAIKRIVDANMGGEIFREVNMKGYDPREFTLFAFGGAGPTHCCGYATFIETPRIITCPQASVFSAYGVSVMDFVNVHEETNGLVLLEPMSAGNYLKEYERFNETVRLLQRRATRDMELSADEAGQLVFRLELDLRYGTQPNLTRIPSPCLFVQSEEDLKAICSAFEKEYGRLYSPAATYPQGGVELVNMVLWTTRPVPKRSLPVLDLKGELPVAALKGSREVFWDESGSPKMTKVFDYAALQCGNIVEGPAIIEAIDTTYVVPAGFRYTMDKLMNGVIQTI
ncbi:MAG: hydantoinase/oxoprolinase family protein [Chloroflexota bacterium]|nr:MAG: hydantoinase/oxoprolinase family protein [Chloroflexota bacterium]